MQTEIAVIKLIGSFYSLLMFLRGIKELRIYKMHFKDFVATAVAFFFAPLPVYFSSVIISLLYPLKV